MNNKNIIDENFVAITAEGMKEKGDSIYGWAIAAIVATFTCVVGGIIEILKIRSTGKANNVSPDKESENAISDPTENSVSDDSQKTTK